MSNPSFIDRFLTSVPDIGSTCSADRFDTSVMTDAHLLLELAQLEQEFASLTATESTDHAVVCPTTVGTPDPATVPTTIEAPDDDDDHWDGPPNHATVSDDSNATPLADECDAHTDTHESRDHVRDVDADPINMWLVSVNITLSAMQTQCDHAHAVPCSAQHSGDQNLSLVMYNDAESDEPPSLTVAYVRWLTYSSNRKKGHCVGVDKHHGVLYSSAPWQKKMYPVLDFARLDLTVIIPDVGVRMVKLPNTDPTRPRIPNHVISIERVWSLALLNSSAPDGDIAVLGVMDRCFVCHKADTMVRCALCKLPSHARCVHTVASSTTSVDVNQRLGDAMRLPNVLDLPSILVPSALCGLCRLIGWGPSTDIDIETQATDYSMDLPI
jgi:hypothetical protein